MLDSSLQPNARLIGVEYVISRPLVEALPEEEKKRVLLVVVSIVFQSAMRVL